MPVNFQTYQADNSDWLRGAQLALQAQGIKDRSQQDAMLRKLQEQRLQQGAMQMEEARRAMDTRNKVQEIAGQWTNEGTGDFTELAKRLVPVDPNTAMAIGSYATSTMPTIDKFLGSQLQQGKITLEEAFKYKRQASESPKTVQEWEFYNTLPEKEKEEYLTMKRAQPAINLGGSQVIPSRTNPQQPAATYTKTLPPEQQTQHIADVEAAKKEETRKADIKKSFPQVKARISSLEKQWDTVESKIDEALKEVSPWTAGIGSWLSVVPATPQRNLRETLDTIRANIGFDKLQDMRANSPTGGALGQVSDLENRLLQAVQGSLDQGQSPAQLRQNLEDIKRLLIAVREEKKIAFNTDYADLIGENSQTGAPLGWSIKRIK